MIFDDAERAYLSGQRLGRLATVDADGRPQNNPVSFALDPGTGTIDISGFSMGASRKFRNVARGSGVAFVVDDIESLDPWKVRGIEIRGAAEALTDQPPANAWVSGEIIRIHPRWVHSWGLGAAHQGSRRV